MRKNRDPQAPGGNAAAPGHPSRDECFRLLADRNVPPHIVAHSRVVAAIAAVLGTDLVFHGRLRLDLPLLEAAALLHDIAKADSFGKPLLDHARQGGDLLRSLGYPAVATIIERHIYVTEEDCSRPLAEDQILCYADKRVLHDRAVSLDCRYDDLVARYGTTPRLGAVIEGNRALAQALEQKIFHLLPYAPGELAERRQP